MSRKPFAVAAAGTALLLGLAACGSSGGTSSSAGSGSAAGPTPTVKIMVGGLNKQIYLPFKLTQQLGFFAQQGVNVQLSDEPAGVDAEDAMLAGQVDGVGGFYDHTIDLQSKGKQTESVVQLLQVPGEVELCRTDEQGSIHSPADFAGKRLGVTGLGSSTNFLSKYLATRAGVEANKTTSVAVQAGNTFIGAMQHKTIDCGMTTEPTISAVLQKHLGFVLVDMRSAAGAQQALGGVYPASALYMKTDWVNAHKPTVQKVVNALVETMHWIKTHTAAQIADQMPADYYAGVGKDAYVTALDNEKGIYTPDGVMPNGGPETVYQVLKSFDPTVQNKQVDLKATYTTEFAAIANQTIK
jgi:NitT/TauT family transport system substrate-binding protein